ncbi:hypothetical protein FRC02_008821 [Tulasnella sp. 418]|nr:hypothetical protein FRC02_008821 [Tulasnella sp. 418]
MSTSQRLVAFPSVTHSLATLPHATNVSNVSIHYPLTPGGHTQQSEDKLRRAIARQNASGYSSASSIASDSSSTPSGDYLMMGNRKSR